MPAASATSFPPARRERKNQAAHSPTAGADGADVDGGMDDVNVDEGGMRDREPLRGWPGNRALPATVRGGAASERLPPVEQRQRWRRTRASTPEPPGRPCRAGMFEAPDVDADGNSADRPIGMMRDRNCGGERVERGV